MQILAYVILSLVIAAAAYVVVARRRHLRLKRQSAAAFASVYAKCIPSPTFEFSYRYGYPAFKIIFRSKLELQSAAEKGLNASFTEAIAELCKQFGPKSRPFEATRAVFFTYEGHAEELLAQAKTVNGKAGPT